MTTTPCLGCGEPVGVGAGLCAGCQDMPAMRLRAAAKVLHDRAARADEGGARWIAVEDERDPRIVYVDTDGDHLAPDGSRTARAVAECMWGHRDADYIATVHPGVGLAMWAWLLAAKAATDSGRIGPGDGLYEYALHAANAILGTGTETTP